MVSVIAIYMVSVEKRGLEWSEEEDWGGWEMAKTGLTNGRWRRSKVVFQMELQVLLKF